MKKHLVPISAVREVVGDVLKTNRGPTIISGEPWVLVRATDFALLEHYYNFAQWGKGDKEIVRNRQIMLPYEFTKKFHEEWNPEYMKPTPEETDPKPVTAPWPGDDIKTPDDSDPDTKIPLVR